MSNSDVSLVEDDELRVDVAIRQALSKTTLKIEWDRACNGNFASVDSFAKLSKGNNIVQEVQLDPYWYQNRIRRSDPEWEEKLGRALGNLQSLKELRIEPIEENWGVFGVDPPDWKTVARVLQHVRQKITLSVRFTYMGEHGEGFESEEGFARAIRGHPTIQRFETDASFHVDSFGILASALATLPVLESAILTHDIWHEHLEDLPDIEHPEHITTLLLSPSLRSVTFNDFCFPNSACQAVAIALRTGSPITCLHLTNCRFPDGGAGSIVHALQRNSTLKTFSIVFEDEFDESASGALTSVLLGNKTLMDLTVRLRVQVGSMQFHHNRGTWLQSFFVAMRMNTSLKKLNVSYVCLTDELVGAALRDVLAENSVLEELVLGMEGSLDDSHLVSWRKTLPFLRNNKTLKSLTINVDCGFKEPRALALCLDTVAMLKDNTSLEILDIQNYGVGHDDYFTALESLQTNTTMKTLRLHPKSDAIRDDGKIKHLISLVKKIYGLESLDEGLVVRDPAGELDTVLRLNRAGRRYLIQPAGSIANGVEVLVAVRDDLGCLFYHLLENPLLCDIDHRYMATGTIADGPVHSNKRQRTSK
jgi:hypothetical protein